MSLLLLLALVVQQPERMIGLVELPGVFGSRDPTGPPGLVPPPRIEPISLHAGPSSESSVLATVSRAEDLETREYEYEAPGAVVYERRGSWHRIGFLRDSTRLLGWIHERHAGRFMAAGWIPAHAAGGRSNAWFYVRGC